MTIEEAIEIVGAEALERSRTPCLLCECAFSDGQLRLGGMAKFVDDEARMLGAEEGMGWIVYYAVCLACASQYKTEEEIDSVARAALVKSKLGTKH